MEPMPLPHRPASVSVIAVICICFGALGLLTLLRTAAGLLIGGPLHQKVTSDLMEASATFRVWTYIATPVGLAIISLQLAAGIGLWRLKAWARKLAIVWSISSMALSSIALAVNISIAPIFAQVISTNRLPPEAAQMMVAAMFIGAFLVAMTLAVIVLVILTRKNVKEAFRVANAVLPPATPAVTP